MNETRPGPFEPRPNPPMLPAMQGPAGPQLAPVYPPPYVTTRTDKQMAVVIYALYLAGFAIGFTPIVGLIIAYVNRGEGDPIADTHYTFAIRTFWISCLYALISVILCFVLVGFALLLLMAIWWIVRCAKGIAAASEGRPILKPKTWIW